MREWVSAAALLALAACGGGDRDGNQVTIETPEGEVKVRADGSAAANLPEGIPAFPGSQAQTSVSVQGREAGQAGTIVGLSTAAPPAEVMRFYNEAAQRAGYSVSANMTMGDTAMLTADRNGQSLHITASRAGAETHIQIIAGQSQ